MVDQCTQLVSLIRIELAEIARGGFFQYIHDAFSALIMFRGQRFSSSALRSTMRSFEVCERTSRSSV
jgi:hypothetical protein